MSADQEAECERVKTSECKNVFVLPSVESENFALIKRKYISEIALIDSFERSFGFIDPYWVPGPILRFRNGPGISGS